MHILYDGCIYYYQRAGGINRYISNLIANLPPGYVPWLTAPTDLGINPPTHPQLKVLRYLPLKPGFLTRPLQERYFALLVGARKPSILHPTYYKLLFDRELRGLRSPVVLTVHDMIHELFSETMDPDGSEAAMKRRSILAADAIVCVSYNTRQDLIERYPQIEDKVSVIHSAGNIDIHLSHGPEPVPAAPYFLYVGSRNANYKNFSLVLEAMATLVARRSELNLCVAGAPLTDTEQGQISTLHLEEHVCSYAHVEDAHLAKLYRYSLALVYPSVYEGFGIPPLEAMACGAPVIAVRSSSLPEVIGEAGVLLDPRSLSELSDAMLHLADSELERDRLRVAGMAQAQKFNWQKTALQTAGVYDSVAS